MKGKNKNKNKTKGVYYAQTRREKSSDSDIDVQYEVQRILAHRIKKNYRFNYIFDQKGPDERKLTQIPNHELEFLVHWKGYGSDVETWEPGQNLQNAPTIINQYKQKYSNPMHSAKATPNSNRRGRRPKTREVDKNGKSQPRPERPTRGFKFDKIFKEDKKNVKEADEDSDQLCIIDEVTFVEGTKRDKNKNNVTNSIQLEKERKETQQNSPLQVKPGRKEKSVEIEICQQPIPVPEQRQLQLVEGDDQQDQIMPANYCAEVVNQPMEQPSRSLSSYLNQSCQNQKNLSRVINNGSNGKSEKEKEQTQNAVQIMNNQEETLKPSQFKKRSEAELAKLFNSLQSQQDKKPETNQPRILQNEKNEHETNKTKKTDHAVDKDKTQQGFIQQQVSKKRNNSHEYDPAQTKQNLTKKIKVNTQVNSSSKLNSPQKLQTSNLIQKPEERKKQGELLQNKDSFQKMLRESADVYLKRAQIPVGETIKKISLNQRIDRQIKSLYEIQPINLLDECGQNIRSKSKKNQVSCNASLSNMLGYKTCRQCNRAKNSYDLLVDYIKFHLKEMNDLNCAVSLERIYQEQQTFILVNGLNPNIDMDKSDKIKKLVMLENHQYLESTITRKAAREEEVDEIADIYKLAKVVWARGEWFGVFKAEKLMIEKSHYRYVRIKDLTKNHKQKIVSYLTEKE